MSVKIIVAGRNYTVPFEVFEKMLNRAKLGTCIEVVSIVNGGAA